MAVKTPVKNKKSIKKIQVSKPKAPKTKITVNFDVGFENQLYVRGDSGGLNWEQGTVLKNIGPCEWIWECKQAFDQCQFKILINDQVFESGENHQIECGDNYTLTPAFSS